MDAKTISEALGGKRYGNSYRAPCPVCGGSEKSTKFTLKDAGNKVLVHCFAGCDFIDIVAELRSRGLWPEPDKLPTKQAIEYKRNKSRAEIEEALNHELLVLIQIVGNRVADRMLAKDSRFRKQRPDWRPLPNEHWDRELLAAERIKNALGVLYV